MELYFKGDTSSIADGLKRLSKRFNIQLSTDGYPIQVRNQQGPLRAANKSGQGEISFERPIHFFRALGLWLEHFQKGGEFELTENPQ